MQNIIMGLIITGVAIVSMIFISLLSRRFKVESERKRLEQEAKRRKNSFTDDLRRKLDNIEYKGKLKLNNGRREAVEAWSLEDAIDKAIRAEILMRYKDKETEVKVHGESIQWGDVPTLAVYILHGKTEYQWNEVY